MAATREEPRSLSELLRALADEGRQLFRQEARLARAEAREKIALFRRSAVSLAIGGALLAGASLCLLAAANRGVTVLYNLWMPLWLSVWLAPLSVAIIAAAAGGIFLSRGKSSLDKEKLKPRNTTESLKEDGRWLKDRIR